jgi:DNA-binding LytR/AlgR family response regulator
MRKDRLYLFTLAGITLAVTCINILSINQLIKTTTEQLLRTQLESSRREAFEISKILETQISNGVSQEEVIGGLQRSIENTSMETGFICMYTTSGVEICHPNRSRLGQKITSGNSILSGLGEITEDNFFDILQKGKERGGVRSFLGENRTEIIYVYPVKDTDWMLAAHANISSLQKRLATVKVNIILINSLASALIILISFAIARGLGSRYEKGIERQRDRLADDVLSLTKLNSDILDYKAKIEQTQIVTGEGNDVADGKSKKRVLTYWRDELVSVAVDEIAFLHFQNGLVYVHCLSKKVYNASVSLDELFESLDKSIFFRANRQFIISIRSIEKIYRYGNNQLKISTIPPAPEAIIISKNKAAEFKDWLDA